MHSIFMFRKEKEDTQIIFLTIKYSFILEVDVVFCYYLIMIQYLNDTHFNFLSNLLLFILLFMSISFDIYILTILM